jgi:hypothetical protein
MPVWAWHLQLAVGAVGLVVAVVAAVLLWYVNRYAPVDDTEGETNEPVTRF